MLFYLYFLVPIVIFFCPAVVAAEELNPCQILNHRGTDYTVCRVNTQFYALRLYWRSSAGLPLASLYGLEAEIKSRGYTFSFAMNAGMYDWKLAPVGLYVENGKEIKPLNKRAGSGNFHLKPNGVFFVRQDGSAGVMDTQTYAASGIKPQFATQSGPMLVIHGNLHPRLAARAKSQKYRNGVGVSNSGEVYFAISMSAVTFPDFASLFKDRLHTGQALFLDGTVSSLRSGGKTVQGDFWPLGPMIGIDRKTP